MSTKQQVVCLAQGHNTCEPQTSDLVSLELGTLQSKANTLPPSHCTFLNVADVVGILS